MESELSFVDIGRRAPLPLMSALTATHPTHIQSYNPSGWLHKAFNSCAPRVSKKWEKAEEDITIKKSSRIKNHQQTGQ